MTRLISPLANRLRRRAKAIKKHMSIALHQAQEMAAQEAGYSNWHAFITTQKRQPPPANWQSAKRSSSMHTESAVAKRTTRPRGIAYAPMFSTRPRYRPPQGMDLGLHRRAGKVLKRLYVWSEGRAGVHHRIAALRATLDDWVQREYDHRVLPYAEFLNLYYGDGEEGFKPLGVLNAESVETFGAGLSQIEHLLREGYADCRPRDELLNDIHHCRVALQRWYAVSVGPVLTPGRLKTPRHRREIPPVTPTMPVYQMSAAEAVRHAIRLLTEYLSTFGKEWRRAARRDALYNRMRCELPYVFQETKSADRYILVNRDYKPVGLSSDEHINYEGYPNLHVHLAPSQLKSVAINPESYGLFHDGCTPWRKRIYAEAYVDRLRKLLAYIS